MSNLKRRTTFNFCTAPSLPDLVADDLAAKWSGIKFVDFRISSPSMRHPDLGKRVTWTTAQAHTYSRDAFEGTLLAVNCDDNYHLVQLDVGGFTLLDSGSRAWSDAMEQGVKIGTNRLAWITGYTLKEEKTLENLEVGDFVKTATTQEPAFRRVLAVLGGEGELRTYAMSDFHYKPDHVDLKKYGRSMTVYDLRIENLVPCNLASETVTELTLQEIADKFGLPVESVKIKD